MEPKYFENEIFKDSRGEFRRFFDSKWAMVKEQTFSQASISKNPKCQTLRGMHFQTSGPLEHKLITVLSGSIHLVISNAHLVSDKTEVRNMHFPLSEDSSGSLFVPSGLATGWVSLKDNTVISYVMTARFQECEFSGFRFDDSFADITWPLIPEVISQKDLLWPPLA